MIEATGSISGIAGQDSNITQLDSSGNGVQIDSVNKNLQTKITNAQQKLHSLSSDEKMTQEEKLKKRQEIRQEITNLNQKLRQHQLDQKREERAKERAEKQAKEQAKNDAMADNARRAAFEKKETVQQAASEEEENQESGLPQKKVSAMISADGSMKQAKVYKSVETQLGAVVSILQSEINLDSVRGQNTEKKQEKLTKIQKKTNAATGSQMSVLGDVNKAVKKAVEDEQDGKKIKRDNGLTLLKGDNGPKKKIGEYVTLDIRG